MTAAREPYWRSHVRAFRNGRLEWYAEPASEEFWAEVWTQRLSDDYYTPADRGNLQDIGDVLLRHLGRGGVHLEAGCGLGYWVAALKARGYAVEGIEFSAPLVEAVNRARPDLAIRHGDALSIDCPDAFYDSYLSFGVVEHLQRGPEPFLLEAFRVLKPGGVMIISVPYLSPLRALKARLGLYRREPPSSDFFQYAFGETEFVSLIQSSGFRIREISYQAVQRCLVEELPLYFHLNRMRGARHVKRAVTAILPARLAGHLILAVAEKPTGGREEAIVASPDSRVSED